MKREKNVLITRNIIQLAHHQFRSLKFFDRFCVSRVCVFCFVGYWFGWEMRFLGHDHKIFIKAATWLDFWSPIGHNSNRCYFVLSVPEERKLAYFVCWKTISTRRLKRNIEVYRLQSFSITQHVSSISSTSKINEPEESSIAINDANVTITDHPEPIPVNYVSFTEFSMPLPLSLWH